MDLGEVRNEYTRSSLEEEELLDNPILMVKNWIDEALKLGATEATAMSLSTIDNKNFPQTRIVLVKSVTDEGISFFTNYDSHKGTEIKLNQNVSLHFFWAEIQRQIRITGIAKKVDKETSDNYFSSRPWSSQLSALASNQSQEIKSRKVLEDKFSLLEKEFKDKAIPRPKNWGGYIVEPLKIEFWQGRENRLHDRFLYTRDNVDWKIKRLAP